MSRTIHYRLALTGITLSAIAALPAAGQTSTEDAKLIPSDGAPFDYFGSSVAISSTTAVIGAYAANDNGSDSGSAFLFDTTTGQQIAKLLPSDGAAGDRFGISVAISGTTAVVGAWLDDDNGTSSGSAYLFDTTTGQQIAKLLPSDGAAGDLFGISVAISGTTVIVGARDDDDRGASSGSAYLFDATTGQQIAKLLPTVSPTGDRFGSSVAISGSTAVVGAPGDDDNGSDSGSVYFFDTITGQRIAKIRPADGEAFDSFGSSVAISGTRAVVGNNGDDDNGENSGSAYIFDTTTGQQIAKLLPSDGASGDEFGISVAISGSTVVVGAYGGDNNSDDSGSAYLFDTTTGQQAAKLLPTDGAGSDLFGISVAINGTTTLVGAFRDDDNGEDSGSAYFFTAPSPCAADLTDDGTLDFFDVSAFLTGYQNQDPIADFNADGSFNFFDVAAFLAAFSAGCP
jgi:hypothetical protein